MIEPQTLQEAMGLHGFLGTCLGRLVFWVLGAHKANRLYSRKPRPDGPAFSKEILEELGVRYEIPPEQLERIPAQGGFITVSNHHFGAIDGMILNAVIGSRRPDYRILTTYFLSLISNLKDWFIPVDNFASGGARSVAGIREALGHLKEGGPLGLFPAGEVASWQEGANRSAPGTEPVIEDRPWAENMMKLVLKSGFPVIPIYFNGTNSPLFHRLGKIHRRLRTLRLVREMLRGYPDGVLQVRIGQPITAEQMAGMDTATLGRYLRSRCYALEAQCLEVEKPASAAKMAPVDPPVDPELVRSQIAAVQDKLLFQTGDYQAYLLKESDAPAVLKDLYRLREETFRLVGEGTGKSTDTDVYDQFYRHLVLWHVPDGAIAGAYRLGYGSELMAAHGGEKGFYTSTLVRFGPDADEILAHSVELGRSFVAARYQRDVLPLKLLFAGLCLAFVRDPSAQYCVGLVTVSAAMPDFYKSLAFYFLERHFALPDADRFASATHPFKQQLLRVNPEHLLSPVPPGDMDHFDRLLGALSDGKYRLPVLFRKYFSCGARVSCINVDPDFSDGVDAMIVLRLSEFPVISIKSFVRSLPQEQQNAVLRHFFGSENV